MTEILKDSVTFLCWFSNHVLNIHWKCAVTCELDIFNESTANTHSSDVRSLNDDRKNRAELKYFALWLT